jgi:hypothetical protein
MPEGYVEIEGVRYDGIFPSGKAIRVIANAHFYNIPTSVIHDDSEIHADTSHMNGTLILREDFAVKKGLIDDEPEGSGILLKKFPRSRLSPPEGLMSVKQFKKIKLRVDGLQGKGIERSGPEVYRDDQLIAIFEGPTADREAWFYCHAISDVHLLLAENKKLRAWASKVIGK